MTESSGGVSDESDLQIPSPGGDSSRISPSATADSLFRYVCLFVSVSVCLSVSVSVSVSSCQSVCLSVSVSVSSCQSVSIQPSRLWFTLTLLCALCSAGVKVFGITCRGWAKNRTLS